MLPPAKPALPRRRPPPANLPGCIPKWERTLAYLLLQPSHNVSSSSLNLGQTNRVKLSPHSSITLSFAFGRSGPSALPCAGAAPPQRPALRLATVLAIRHHLAKPTESIPPKRSGRGIPLYPCTVPRSCPVPPNQRNPRSKGQACSDLTPSRLSQEPLQYNGGSQPHRPSASLHGGVDQGLFTSRTKSGHIANSENIPLSICHRTNILIQ